MLRSAKALERRRNFRHYYEMCRVGVAPHLKKEDRKKIEAYYWEGSLSDSERAAQIRVVNQAHEDAKKTGWVSTKDVLGIIRGLK